MFPFLPITEQDKELAHKIYVMTRYLKFNKYHEIGVLQGSFLFTIKPTATCIDIREPDFTNAVLVIKNSPRELISQLGGSRIDPDKRYLDPVKSAAAFIVKYNKVFQDNEYSVGEQLDSSLVHNIITSSVYLNDSNVKCTNCLGLLGRKDLFIFRNEIFLELARESKTFYICITTQQSESDGIDVNNSNYRLITNLA